MENTQKTKRPTNKELLTLFEEELEVAKKLIANKGEGQKPNELVTIILNVISVSLKDAAKEDQIDYLLNGIAYYVNLYRFNERKKRELFEKSFARISEQIMEKGLINAIETLEILVNTTKKLVR